MKQFSMTHCFDITRYPNDHIAFGGGGAHYCLGANLARAEPNFKEVITRMPDIQLAGEPSRLRSNFIGGIKHLPVFGHLGGGTITNLDEVFTVRIGKFGE